MSVVERVQYRDWWAWLTNLALGATFIMCAYLVFAMMRGDLPDIGAEKEFQRRLAGTTGLQAQQVRISEPTFDEEMERLHGAGGGPQSACGRGSGSGGGCCCGGRSIGSNAGSGSGSGSAANGAQSVASQCRMSTAGRSGGGAGGGACGR